MSVLPMYIYQLCVYRKDTRPCRTSGTGLKLIGGQYIMSVRAVIIHPDIPAPWLA